MENISSSKRRTPHAGLELEEESIFLLASRTLTDLETGVNWTVYWMRPLALDSP